MKNDRLTVKRHSLLYRVLHWLIAAEIALLLLSGLCVSEYIHFSLFSRGAARSFHIVLGMAWMSSAAFFIYYFIMSGEYKWFGLSRLGQAFDLFVHEVKCFIEGKHLPSPIRYDGEEKKYVEKIMPTEVLAWWGWFALWMVMAVSGLALLFPENFALVNRISHFFLPLYERSASATRFIHLSATTVIVLYVLIHAYASWVFGMVGSMVSGTNAEPVTERKR